MISVITSFTLPAETTPEQVRQIFVSSAPRFLRMPGLRHKCLLLTEDGRTGMGFYIWEDRQHAEGFFTEDWKQFMLGKYGSWPTVTYYECVVEIDNILADIRTA